MIDDASYNEGRADFDNGVSLRTLVSRVQAADDADEVKMVSLVIGFAHALLDRLRSTPAEPR